MKIRKAWIALLAAGAFAGLALSACSDANVSPAVDNSGTEEMSTYALVSAPLEFDDATIDQPVKERPNPNLDPRGPKPMPHPFARLLKALNLTEDQALQVRTFLQEHDDCVRAAMNAMHEQQRAIIERAKAARQEVLDALKAGEITREEAKAKIHAINQAAREALKNATNRAAVKEAIKACDAAFLRQLASILTEEQMAILKRYLEGKPADGGGSTGGRKP